MTTIIERNAGNGTSDSSSSAITAVLAVVAIVVVLGLLFFASRGNFFGAAPRATNGSTPINVDVKGTLPTTPAAQ